MSYPPLSAAWAKYNRAARDLGVLNKNVRAFLARKPYVVEIEFELATDTWVVRARIVEEPPPVFGVLVGSMAHQCFSALNHITWALAARKLGESKAHALRRQLDFPICEDEATFRKRKVLEHVSKDAARKLEQLQPFHHAPEAHGRVQHPLLLVKELADADKHRVLPATYGSVQLGPVLRGEAFAWDESAAAGLAITRTMPPRAKRRMLRSGTELVRVRFDQGNPQAALRLTGEPVAEVHFQSDNWAGVSLQSIGSCVPTVDRCISVLAPLFPRESWPPSSHDDASPYEW